MSTKYTVYTNARYNSEHMGLIGACVHARTEAVAQPGTLWTVERDGRKHAKYQVVSGKLQAWML